MLTGGSWALLRRGLVPGGAGRWSRTNHAGRQVTLLEGVAWVSGACVTGLLGRQVSPGGPVRADATVLVVLASGAVGALDDLRQDTDRKGLTGHLGALAHGRLTTGAVKILVLVGAGLGGAWWSDRGHGLVSNHAGDRCSGALDGRVDRVPLLDTLVGGAVVAGCANLANLLDLRPGRALKAGLLCGLPLLLRRGSSGTAGLAVGASAALLRDDLAGRSMLGDTGANPLGAALGLALVQRSGRRGRLVTLGALTALTLASERVSFSQVIDDTAALRWLDRLGRPGG